MSSTAGNEVGGIDELLEKCRLTDEEAAACLHPVPFLYPEHRKLLDAQLRKAILIIQKAERERIAKEMEDCLFDSPTLVRLEARIQDLINYLRGQALRGEGNDVIHDEGAYQFMRGTFLTEGGLFQEI